MRERAIGCASVQNFLDFRVAPPQFGQGNRLIGLLELPGRIEHHEFHERAVAI
jgi:hypothetical protein